MTIETSMTSLIDHLYDIKNKLTTQEYIDLMKNIQSLHSKITILEGKIEEENSDYDSCYDNIDNCNRYYNDNAMSDSDDDDI
tara:strand:- start:915 stop:1160 length:246 start_codon:yes stop_codon:yes gene_type:complete